MTGPAGFLDFFILEASEYVEQLDGLVLDAGGGPPDVDAVQRIARALRGTATMAKLPAFAELAGAIERVGRALHDRSLSWDQSLRGAVVSAIDDLKSLLHAARTWSPAEDERARARGRELARYAPARRPRPTGRSRRTAPRRRPTPFSPPNRGTSRRGSSCSSRASATRRPRPTCSSASKRCAAWPA